MGGINRFLRVVSFPLLPPIFGGRVVAFIRPPSVCRDFWWLVATPLPGLSLYFASGLSSPGLLYCLALSLRYADLLYLWLCAHSLLVHGVRGLLACPSLSRWLWFCMFLWVFFSPMVHTLRDGVTPAGSRLVCPRWERRFGVFTLSLWAVLSVVPTLRDMVTMWVRWVGQFPLMRIRRLSLVLRTFSLWVGFEPLSEASLRTLSLQVCFLVVLAEDESLRLSLALSSVLPCPMLWLQVRLHDTCSRTTVVLGALP